MIAHSDHPSCILPVKEEERVEAFPLDGGRLDGGAVATVDSIFIGFRRA
jgi:hypothetical protein